MSEQTGVTVAVRRSRIALVLLGIAVLGIGAFVLMQEVNPQHYVGILTWLVGALVIHDGVIAPGVWLVTVLMRRKAAHVPPVVVAIVQGALVVGGIVALLVVPEILKKSIGTLNSSILPQNYALNLAIFLVAVVALAALAIAIYLRVFSRRQKLRPSSDQA